MNISDIDYLPDTDEIEVVDYYGFPTYHKLYDLTVIDANERELGTEVIYLIEPNIHIVFYPEGRFLTWYEEK